MKRVEEVEEENKTVLFNGLKVSQSMWQALLDDHIIEEIPETSNRNTVYYKPIVNGAKGILGKSNLVSILDTIEANFPEYADLIRMIRYDKNGKLRNIEEIPVIFSNIVGQPGFSINGKNERYLYINPESSRYKRNPELVMLHEILHQMTSLAINNSKEIENGINEFMEYIKKAVNNSKVNLIYPFENAKEFLAHLETSRSFKEFLKRVAPMESKEYNDISGKIKHRNVFSQLIHFLFDRIFGTQRYNNAYEQAVNILFNVMEVQNNHYNILFNKADKSPSMLMADLNMERAAMHDVIDKMYGENRTVNYSDET
jgi:hypothetical protein